MGRKITPAEIMEVEHASHQYRLRHCMNLSVEVQDVIRANEKAMRLAAMEIEQLEKTIARLSDADNR